MTTPETIVKTRQSSSKHFTRTSVVCVPLLGVGALLVRLVLRFVLKIQNFWSGLTVRPLECIEIRGDGKLCAVEEAASVNVGLLKVPNEAKLRLISRVLQWERG